MAIDPSTIRIARYSGTPYNQPTDLRPSQQQPRVVPLSFNWLTYFTALATANIAVEINLAGGTVQGGLLDVIKGVKIDNTNSAAPISVYFPDTGDIVSCPPQSVVSGAVLTNGLRCFVIGQGLSAGVTPLTKVYLTNYYQPAFYDPQLQISFPQQIGSPLIQRDNLLTPGYAGAALGDQLQSIILNMDGVGNTQSLWGGRRATGFIYLTALDVEVSNLGSGVQQQQNVLIENADTRVTLLNMPFTVVSSVISPTISICLCNLSNMNVRLDATKLYQVRNAAALTAGLCTVNSAFTVNPN